MNDSDRFTAVMKQITSKRLTMRTSVLACRVQKRAIGREMEGLTFRFGPPRFWVRCGLLSLLNCFFNFVVWDSQNAFHCGLKPPHASGPSIIA